jgi:DegV family protein with EDD domain
MNYEIVTDTSANLPSELAREKEIGVIPFSYYVEGEEHVCLDTDAFDGADYYGKLRSRVKITTSQITPLRYVEHLEPLLKEGRDVLYIGMSSGISGSYQSAVIAAQQLREAYPERKIKTVDTLGASLGEGLVVLKAAQWRSEGKTIDEAETAANEMARHMYQIFIVDDLFQLRQLGRLSNAASIVGTVLQIKPLLKGNEQGQIVCIGKERGRRKAIRALADHYKALVKDASQQIVGIAHADCAEDAEFLNGLLREAARPKSVLNVLYEPVTGCHVGAGTLALFFLGDENVRSRD